MHHPTDLANRFGIEPRDIEELIAEGLIHPQAANGGELRLRPTDLEWIEILANLRKVGLTPRAWLSSWRPQRVRRLNERFDTMGG